LADPVSLGLGAAVWGSLGWIAEKGAQSDWFKTWFGGCKTRVEAMLGRDPANHDLFKGVRTAHLCALERVMHWHAEALEHAGPGTNRRDEEAFAYNVRRFVDKRLRLLSDATIDHEATTARDALHVLEGLIQPERADGYADAASRGRRQAEAAALAELETFAGDKAPALFRQYFGGRDPGWYDAFALRVTEEIKTNKRFQAIFFADLLGAISQKVDAVLEAMKAVKGLEGFLEDVRGRLVRIHGELRGFRKEAEGRFDRLEAMMAGLGASKESLAKLEAEVEQLREAKTLTDDAILAALRTIGASGEDPSKYPALLLDFANRFVALEGELSARANVPAEFQKDREAAAAALRKGDLDRADAILKGLSARMAQRRRETEEMLRQDKRDEANVLAERAGLASLRYRHAEALALHREAIALDPDRILSWGEIGAIGEILGRLDIMLEGHNGALQLARRSGDQPNEATALTFVGDVLVAQGNLAAALKSFQAGLDIIDRLAKDDPKNAGWQRDLSVSFNKIGDVLAAQGNLAAAPKSFQAAQNISERLAKDDPKNAGWQRDLSVSLEMVGNVLVAQGNLAAALKSFQAGLDIRDRLAKDDPQNAGWLADLAASHGKMGRVLKAAGRNDEARAHFLKGRGIVAPLVEQAPDVVLWREYLTSFEQDIASLGV
jgi:tetratricopeptide (TPR) repeat protein